MPDRHRPREVEDEYCHYCEVKLSRRIRTIDHIVPQSLGGKDERWNYVLACRSCNEKKANKAPTCKCNKCRKSVRIHWQQYRIRLK